MFTEMKDLPGNILGIRADGEITRNDYENVLIPLLEKAYRKGEKIRFLYQFSPEYSSFSAGAAWSDFTVGMKYLRLFERCAVVTDVDWIRHSMHLFGSLFPCPVRDYSNAQMDKAIEWLKSPDVESSLSFEMKDNGVLVLHPHGPLQRGDFDKVANVIDPWIESHKNLNGLVIAVPKFPGWENFGSFVRHMEFIKGHHRKVRRVAIVADGILPELVSNVAKHFVEAEVKQFPFGDTSVAELWAGKNGE